MKIKRLTVNGFRCLKCLDITFEDNITVIVGENDCGKTSLIECLKVITQNKPVEPDDFKFGSNRIELSIEIEDFVFRKIYIKQGDQVSPQSLEAKPTKQFLLNIQNELGTDSFDIAIPENVERVKAIARLFGLIVRSNSNVENLKNLILEMVLTGLSDPNFKLDGAQFPRFNNIQLDGKQFENVSSFFKEVFLNEKQSSIWKESIGDGVTIEEFVRQRIDQYAAEISSELVSSGMRDKFKLFLKNLTDIRIEPIYQTRDLNIDAKVVFLENGDEINIQKKGDGTKRRITMGLLELKKERANLSSEGPTIYLLDEPDTHLHVRAQNELLETLQTFAENGHQIILTTHSPFILNSVQPKQVRLLSLDDCSCTCVKQLLDSPTLASRVLESIGIENVYLFFAKTIIIVEGETEEAFISNYYHRRNRKSINSDLIKIINVEGIQNVYGFAKGILELHDPERIFLVFDNDASDDLRELIGHLRINDKKKFIIGEKEFEDSFSDESLFDSWKKYQESNGRQCPDCWTVVGIQSVRESCQKDASLKFSKKIKQLNARGKTMTKPMLGYALARFIDDGQLPPRLAELFEVL
jgi:putative ATP-dependent endonuclease of the OLD family